MFFEAINGAHHRSAGMRGDLWSGHVSSLDSDEDIDDLAPERVEDLARFVSGMGSRLAPAREDIEEAIESADASGFDLEHVDDIRYGIRSEIWESGALSLKAFVDLLGKQASANRP
jgi:hypothetical protein